MFEVRPGQETDLEHLKFVLRLKLAMGAYDTDVANLKKSILVCEGMNTEMDAMEYMQEINSVTLPKSRKEKIENIRSKIVENLKGGQITVAESLLVEMRQERQLMQSAIRDMKAPKGPPPMTELTYPNAAPGFAVLPAKTKGPVSSVTGRPY